VAPAAARCSEKCEGAPGSLATLATDRGPSHPRSTPTDRDCRRFPAESCKSVSATVAVSESRIKRKAPPSPAGSVSARMRRAEKGRSTISETNEWNTAPKDGSEINVQFAGGARARARWNAAKNGGEWEVLWQSGEWVSLKYDRGRGDPDIWWPR